MKRPILEVGPGSRIEVSVPLENYRVRPFMPMCAFADVFLDLVSPDKEVKEKTYGDFVTGDAQKLPFKDEIFYEIYARHLIEHIPNHVSFLSECYRVLKQNGRFHIVCPNYYSTQATRKCMHARELSVK